jgi:hypothetical protein
VLGGCFFRYYLDERCGLCGSRRLTVDAGLGTRHAPWQPLDEHRYAHKAAAPEVNPGYQQSPKP